MCACKLINPGPGTKEKVPSVGSLTWMLDELARVDQRPHIIAYVLGSWFVLILYSIAHDSD
jgi:hypothetical protein